jgi:hypothetical protein
MSQAHDWSWLEEGLVEPEITLDMYLTLPEHLSRKIEEEDGRIIVCESPSPEVVSASTVTEDLYTQRTLNANAGIPHYWIIRMAGDEGIAVSVERLRLDSDRRYVTGGSAHRDRDIFAVSTADPFPITVSWEQLDRGFPPF